MSKSTDFKLNKKGTIILLTLFGIYLIFSAYEHIVHWLNGSQETTVSLEDILPTIENGSTVSFNGNFSDINADAYIEVDDIFLGNITETGLFDTTFSFTANNEELLYIEQGGETAQEGSATLSYASFETDGTHTGYCEMFLGPIHDGTEEYATFFFDGNKQQLPFFVYTDEGLYDDYTLLSNSGEVLYSIDCTIEHASRIYDISLTKESDTIVPAQYLLLLFCHLQNEIKRDFF